MICDLGLFEEARMNVFIKKQFGKVNPNNGLTIKTSEIGAYRITDISFLKYIVGFRMKMENTEEVKKPLVFPWLNV